MTRNYKTGPPRSRRRPDPSQVWQPGIVVSPMFSTSIGNDPGEITVEAAMFQPGGNASYPIGWWSQSILPAGAYVVAVDGTIIPATTTLTDSIGVVEIAATGSFGVGQAYLVLPGLTPAIRAKDGGFLGGIIVEFSPA